MWSDLIFGLFGVTFLEILKMNAAINSFQNHDSFENYNISKDVFREDLDSTIIKFRLVS